MVPINDTIPTEGWPWVTTGLVVANLVVYVLAAGHGGSLISGPSHHELAHYAVVPYALTHPGHHGARPWSTVLSAMFLHATIVQLLVNLLFLAIFGSAVEDAIGPVSYLALYVVGGIAAVALQVAVAPGAAVPTVGAQGAVAATLGAYLVIYTWARVLVFSLVPLFAGVIEVPAVILMVVWFGVQAAFAATRVTDPLGGGGVSVYLAHVGGFALGALTVKRLGPQVRPLPPVQPVRRP